MSARLIDRYPQAQDFTIPGGETAVLMIHGFTASPAQMRPLAAYLSEAGYSVRCPRLPGHGETLDDMVASGWQAWLSAVRTEALHLMETHKKVVVLGLSMGGLLALLMAEELPVDGVISIAAAIHIRNRMAPLARVLAPFLPRQEADPEAGCRDPQDIGYGIMPNKKIPDLLNLARMARNNLSRIHCPMLVAQSKLDESVADDGPKIILEGTVNCFDKEMLWLEKSPHVCTYGEEFPILSAKIGEFMARIDAMDPMD